MARTPRNTVDFFPHFTDASAGDTITVIQAQFGNDGYAFWFKLLERLGRSEGHFIDVRNPIKFNVLCAKCNSTPNKGVEILNLLVELGAIDKDLWDLRVIWCQKFVDNLVEVYRNRKRDLPSKPIITSSNDIITGNLQGESVENEFLGVVMLQRRGEERRGEERRVEERKGEERRGEGISSSSPLTSWESSLGRKATETECVELNLLADKYSGPWVVDSITEAARIDRSKIGIKYISKILKRWQTDGHNNGNNGSSEGLREW
ncbi:MAG: Lin1244/Lin1753 domain-containing protein [Dehalococcoidia bacterium]|jgi:hypothetical protein